ncbi:hypothetical protein SH601_01910 [Gracilibacillus sp. S3-1-1]|uniref:Uncharacterized protein n=1 Tax=Gracilibacillus pellucidus TaxID=3095368 RepID=A0ACC6M1B8_9BACI|nr:hypothetical protein [Gracilibacillus sp. S3-1-1]MDX8044729.1 hypothetical protein [Gracilibacillus sp. S3-1-1]
MELTSKGTGNILKALLTIGIVLSGVLVFTSFFEIYYNDLFERSLVRIDRIVASVYLIIWVISAITYLIWIFKVHRDLRNFHSNYPITSGGALARILIPIYNIFGLWNVFSTIGNYLRERTNTAKHANIILTLIPYYYILYWLTNILNRLISNEQVINIHVIMSSYVLDTVLMVVYLYMTKYIFESLQIINNETTSNNNS